MITPHWWSHGRRIGAAHGFGVMPKALRNPHRRRLAGRATRLCGQCPRRSEIRRVPGLRERVSMLSPRGLLQNRVRPRLRPPPGLSQRTAFGRPGPSQPPEWIIDRVRTQFATARRGPKRHAFTACPAAEVLDAELRSGSRLTRAVVVLLGSKTARDHGLPGCRKPWPGRRRGLGLTRAAMVLPGSKATRVHRLPCRRRVNRFMEHLNPRGATVSTRNFAPGSG
jgi:hypothetical protein